MQHHLAVDLNVVGACVVTGGISRIHLHHLGLGLGLLYFIILIIVVFVVGVEVIDVIFAFLLPFASFIGHKVNFEEKFERFVQQLQLGPIVLPYFGLD